MTFRVETSAEAEDDAEAIRCALAPEDGRFPFTVRHLLHGRKPHIYRILFTIESETVYVLHIRHGRRKSP